MYIQHRKGKKPIDFKDIINGKVFSYGDKLYQKVRYGDEYCAVDLENGVVINTSADKTEFHQCYLFPAAVLLPEGNRDHENDSSVR